MYYPVPAVPLALKAKHGVVSMKKKTPKTVIFERELSLLQLIPTHKEKSSLWNYVCKTYNIYCNVLAGILIS
jgi:hypothetical protein